MDPGEAGALHDLIAQVETGFRQTQDDLRERVIAVASTDGRLALRVNGEGLAVAVTVEPTLLADGPGAVETAVMEAVNNAVMAIHAATTEAFQDATERYLGLAGPEIQAPRGRPSTR